MLFNLLKQINWVDIFILILWFRICYVALKNGLAIEFFKLLGIIAALYLSLHYYTDLSLAIGERLFPAKQKSASELLNFICFLALGIAGNLIFVFLRIIFYRFIKMETAANLNRLLGFAFGIARGFLIAGLIIFTMALSNLKYFKNSLNNAYSGKELFKVAPGSYAWLWNNIASKFATGEKFNNAVLEVQKALNL